MNTTPFPIDRTSILNLQRLYDAFIYDRPTGCYLKSLSHDLRPLQQSHYKGEVFKLYDDLFQASKPEELQMIVRKTNELMSKLIAKFGRFSLDPGFTKVDPLDEILLYDLIDSFSLQIIPL
jgi:hypothetical protein